MKENLEELTQLHQQLLEEYSTIMSEQAERLPDRAMIEELMKRGYCFLDYEISSRILQKAKNEKWTVKEFYDRVIEPATKK